ncbi:MAG: adenylosuccinate lyase [Armatimonadota bacterium]
MIDRYSLPEMRAIWSKESKYAAWLEVEIAVCEAWASLGRIPDWVPHAIRRNARIDVARIEQIEQEVRHDLIAFVKGVQETLGEEGRYLHFGVTSYDIEDPALALLLRRSADILIADAEKLTEVIKRRAAEHKHTLMMGRTHGVHAEPITLGHKFAVWYWEMQRNLERLRSAREVVNCGKVSGAVGTYANVDPRVEQYVCQKLGLTPSPASTQILQRDRHAQFITTLAIVSSSLEKFATEVRNLQRTEIREVEEYFSAGQRGSSAMPHKRNPWNCETVSGLARVMRGYVVPALENITSWHERDLANSSVERVILPDACCVLNFQLRKFTDILDKLVVYPERMRQNVELTSGLIASQQVMLALVDRGLTREEAYTIVQAHAMDTWNNGGSFRDRLLADTRVAKRISPAELDELLAPERHLRNLDVVFQRMGI